MAKRRHGQEAELPFVALMDTMTNVVGVLTIVLVMMGISIAHAVKKILSDLPPATAAQVAEAQASIDKTKAEIAANEPKLASLSSLPNKGDIEAELIRLESQVKEKDIKLFDLAVLGKELSAKSDERSQKEAELSALITERDRLKALLDTTPVPKAQESTFVRIPNSRDIPKDANIYYCYVRADQVYFVDVISAKEMVMGEFKREAWSEDFEILTRPVRGHRVGMMEVKGLHRSVAKGRERSFSILTRNLAGTHQRLQGEGKESTHQQVEDTKPTSRRQCPTQAAERIGGHARGIDEAAAGRIQRDELVIGPEMMLQA
jgi:hypothetical protein